MRSYTMKCLCCCVAAILALFFCTCPVSAATVALEDGYITLPGGQVVVSLTLDEAPGGIVGWSANLTVEDPRVARITAVSFPSWASLKSTSGLTDGVEVRIAGLDATHKVEAGATNVTLATITMQSIINGSTMVHISRDEIEDDSGAGVKLPHALKDGNISIGAFSSGSAGAPAISFTGTPLSGDGPLTVAFTDTSASTPTMWSWSFGDGTYSTSQNPAHTYVSPGTFTVSLIVSNPGGTNSTAEPGYVTVISAPPVTDFSASPVSGTVPHTVSFTDLSLKNPDGWAWYFGDENYSAPWTPGEPWRLMSAAGIGDWRHGHSSIVMADDSIIQMGGFNGVSYWNDVWMSTDYGATWSRINASTAWPPRTNDCSVVMPDSSIILIGGTAGNTHYNDVWRSTDNGEIWTEMTPSAEWSARSGQSCVALQDGSIILMGGYETGSLRHMNDVWKSTDYGATWSLVTSNAGWTKRLSHNSVVMPDGSIVLIGGALNHNSGGSVNDVWRSADSGATWTQMTPSAEWAARGSPGCVVTPDGSIFLMGGNEGLDYTNEVWKSTDYGASWTQMSPAAGWAGRQFYSVVPLSDGSVVLIGGYSSSSSGTFKDVWRFTPPGSSEQNPSHTYTAAGTYSVTLLASNYYGYNTAGKSGYITTTAPVPAVTGITPLTGDSTEAYFNATITGSNFLSGAVVILNRTGFATINATNITVVSSTQITCTFNLTTGHAGWYDVVVTNSDSQSGTLANGFQVTGPAAPPAATPGPQYYGGNQYTGGTSSGASDGDSGGSGSGSGNAQGNTGNQQGGQSGTVSANVGGSSSVGSVVVTGVGVSDIIVTATAVNGPGNGVSPPPGTVFEYLEITPARYTSIGGAEITFSVPLSWLDQQHLAPQDVVMFHNAGGVWEALPTTFARSADGVAYFTATTPGFSRFAIAARPDNTTADEANPSGTVQTFGDLVKASDVSAADTPVVAATVIPVASGTMAAPVQQPAGDGLPVTSLIVACATILIVAAGGFMVRRWWIRRQNPALFEDSG